MKHGQTTERVYEYLKAHPCASLDEMRIDLNISSRANVRYHLVRLSEAGRVDMGDGRSRQYRVIESKL
jgi:predicted transcriptional regulator